MPELTLSELLRCQHVKRWHIVRVAREQTVAEHQWAVAMIARVIADRLHVEPAHLLEWSLWHDVPEVVIGDLPTPMSEAVGHLLEQAEAGVSEKWTSLRVSVPPDSLTATIVKLADLIEAITFLHIDGIGDYARSVRRRLYSSLQQKVAEARDRFPAYGFHRVINEVLVEAQTLKG